MIDNKNEILLTNRTFLDVIAKSFNEFLCSGTSRSTARLKPLHGAIARDISLCLGVGYIVRSQGFGADKEAQVAGRYYDKYVDIAVEYGGRTVAALGIKFVMQNYSKYSNNYFEGMLGETANIRSKGIPYFQIMIILDRLPYYDKNKKIKRWETFTQHNVKKYIALSNDDTSRYMHSPDKTLVYVIHIPDPIVILDDCAKYRQYYLSMNFDITASATRYADLGSSVIVNDYEIFRDKLYHTIKAI